MLLKETLYIVWLDDRICRRFHRSSSKWPERVLLKTEVTNLHPALVDTLHPDDKTVAAQLDHQQVPLAHQVAADQHLAIVRVHGAYRERLDRHSERWRPNGWDRGTRRGRLLGNDRRKTAEFAPNWHCEWIFGTVIGQQFPVSEGRIGVADLTDDSQTGARGFALLGFRDRIDGAVRCRLGGAEQREKEDRQD